MSGPNGNGSGPTLGADCLCGELVIIRPPLSEGDSGQCGNCGREYDIITDDDGDISIAWHLIDQPILIIDAFTTIRNSAEDYRIYPDVMPKVREYQDQGYMTALIGAVFDGGGISSKRAHHIIYRIRAENEGLGNIFQIAYTTRRGPRNVRPRRSLLRPPQPGMLVLIEREMYKESGLAADWDRSLIVADRPEYFIMADWTDVPFKWAWEFFERDWPFGVESASDFRQVVFHGGRSPHCVFCTNVSPDVSPVPTRHSSFSDKWVHKREDRSDAYIPCEDQEWIRTVVRHGQIYGFDPE